MLLSIVFLELKFVSVQINVDIMIPKEVKVKNGLSKYCSRSVLFCS
jgi:hypothetical protein